MKSLPFVTLAATLLAGCSPDVSAGDPASQVKVIDNKVESAADLFPLQPGNAWNFDATQTVRTKDGKTSVGTQTPTLKVVARNGNKATIGYIRDNKVMSKMTVLATNKGVAQSSVQATNGPIRNFEPASPLYEWPMKVNEERKSEGTGYRAGVDSIGKVKNTLVYKGESEVDTPAGRMRAHRFDSLTTYTVGNGQFGSTSSVWLVPKIGIVRSVELVAGPTGLRETELKLTSYTVK
jgi:hypothetical protein